MSIYPVPIKGWYKDPFDKCDMRAFGGEYKKLKTILPHLRCHVCSKPITERWGWVMHSITYGGPDEAFCTKKCVIKWHRRS